MIRAYCDRYNREISPNIVNPFMEVQQKGGEV